MYVWNRENQENLQELSRISDYKLFIPDVFGGFGELSKQKQILHLYKKNNYQVQEGIDENVGLRFLMLEVDLLIQTDSNK